jgi:hypothetical protein
MRIRIPIAASIAAVLLATAGVALAGEFTVVGPVTQIQVAPDGKSATAVLKENESYTITVTDDLTLDKFKDKRIVEGDEIRAKVEAKDGRNASKIFKKTAGC